MNRILEEDFARIAGAKLDWRKLSGRNILVTGANGMLPSYMVGTLVHLIRTGRIENTRIFALGRSAERLRERFRDSADEPCLHFVTQDVCQPATFGEKIDIVIHAASQASPKFYRTDPVGTLLPNVVGTANLLKLAGERGAQQFLFFSSAEVYGGTDALEGRPIRETDFGGLDPVLQRSCYAEGKRAGEALCAAWGSQHGLPVKIVRPFHTYGPGMKRDDGRVFADFAFNLLDGRNIQIKSDGTALRSYCYLADATEAYFRVLLDGKAGEAYNVGNPGQEYSVRALAEALVGIFPEKKLAVEMDERFRDSAYRPARTDRFLPDISKVAALGWSPETDVKTGFFRTVMSYI